MTTFSFSLATLTDADLLAHVTRFASVEREATVQLIASLAELDARRLYLGQGCGPCLSSGGKVQTRHHPA
jgi:hypothetical protein